MARCLTTVVILCLLVTASADLTYAQRNIIKSNDGRDDLSFIIGRCGCEACRGRLEHNDPTDDEDDGDGGNDFEIVNRWTATATSGGGLSQGDPTILTWSIIPDGTDANGGPGNVPSNMIAVWDNLFNESSAGDPDLTTRTWWSRIQAALDRWGELSGVEYVYEPNDDGVVNFGAGGFLGVRGDVRIGGFNIDGPNGFLAFNAFPNVGDMAVDTSDTGNFGNTFANFRAFRNIYTHEQGHGLGFAHLISNNARFLMEPAIDLNFDGPQLDDIRAVHRNYGDVNEKSNNFAGNDSIANATFLGDLDDGDSVVIGTHGATGTIVASFETDFVSVDDNSDNDFYRLSVDQFAFVDITLTPVGATYNQSPEGGQGNIPINTSAQSNLSLTLLNPNGSIIQFANATGVGQPEQIINQVVVPGDFLIRVQGTANTIQLYTLEVSVDFLDVPNATPPSSITADPGMIVEGDAGDLADSDDQRLKVLIGAPAAVGDEPIKLLATFVTPDPLATSLSIDFEGFANTANVRQTIRLLNNDTGQFEEVDSRISSANETSFNISIGGDPTRYIQFPTGLVLMEISYEPVGPVLQSPWGILIDQLLVNTLQ